MSKKTEIALATKNKGKIKEILHYFSSIKNISFRTFEDFNGFPEVEETGTTFKENASIKASEIASYTGMMALADDSGLEVDSLEGEPGVYSSRYAGPDATDKENRDKLLKELSVFPDNSQRKARFVCSMVLWDPVKGMVTSTRGICPGYISDKETGSGGFGYDCLFYPDGFRRTMAELSNEEKNSISHRGHALESLLHFIEKF